MTQSQMNQLTFGASSVFLFLALLSLLFLPWWANLALAVTTGLLVLGTVIPAKTLSKGLIEFLGFVAIMALLSGQIMALGIMLH